MRSNRTQISLSLLSKYRTELMGFSAIGILMCHATGNNVVMPSIVWQICSLGQMGVSIFFLLSGTGMYYSLLKTEQGAVIAWYKARYIKLLVPYLLMAIPFFVWTDIVRNQSFTDFLLKVSTVEFWLRGGGVWFVGAIIPLYLIVPWWHCWLRGMKSSWIPTLVIFVALVCLGKWRHMGEVAFFFVGYWLGKPVSEGRKISLIIWGVIPIVLYAVCKVVPFLDWVPRFLFLVVSFPLIAAFVFDKVGNFVRAPFQFMGKISLESYMSNVMLPGIFVFVPWVINGVNYNEGNRLLYLCVIVFGIPLAYLVNRISKPIIGKLKAFTK